ncbi:hypothetical protein VTO42DRAFT_5484 [Malbranchea cinnamomea]
MASLASNVFWLLSSLSLLIAGSGVDAGNRAWESSIHFARKTTEIEARDLSRSPNFHDNRTTVVTRDAGRAKYEKRWFGIEPVEGGYTLWPKGNIKICFEQKDHMHKGQQKTTEEILKDDLVMAVKLWRKAGLEAKDNWFGVEFVDDVEYCTDRNKRYEFLLVQYAGEGVEEMATTPGVPPRLDPDNLQHKFRDLGPRMLLSDSTNMGMMNVVPNYAHELGHSWGLHHEHQNPRWWGLPYSAQDRDTYFFGQGSWFCDRLSDHDETVQRINKLELSDAEKAELIRDMCRSRSAARAVKFRGAYNWLPVKDEPTQWDDSRKEPDYESIMIYPSMAGGKGTAPNKQLVLLKKPDGDPIQPVSRPSQFDVKGLYHMYRAPKPKIKQLFAAAGSPFKNAIEKIRKKDPDSSCV